MTAHAVMNTTTRGPLGADEIAAYERDGYIVPRYRLPPSELALLKRLTATLVSENPELLDQPIVSPHVPGGGAQGLRSTSEWLRIATHPDLIDITEQLIGPDIILWGSTVFYKRAERGPLTPWHRDGGYWPIRPLATLSIWIAVTDARVENGCLQFIPGSHKARELGRHVKTQRNDVMFPQALDDSEFDAGEAVSVELEPGQMVVFDVYAIHGAGPNHGTAPRAGYSLRFMPATSRFDHDGGDPVHVRETKGAAYGTRALMLVRGVDRAGNDFVRGHPRQAR